MLAPRKTLWSTPPEVIEKAIELLQINSDDVVFDIGAGDGRFVIRCHECTGARCVGIEIDEARAEAALANVTEKGVSPSLCTIIKGNALEQDYSSGTVFFLYLVPRGLKLILPILQRIPRRLRVITYMSPLPDMKYVQLVKIGTQKHVEALWPVYLYELNSHLPDTSPSPLKSATSFLIRPFQEEDAAEGAITFFSLFVFLLLLIFFPSSYFSFSSDKNMDTRIATNGGKCLLVLATFAIPANG